MGEVVLRDCVMNALPANDRSETLSSLEFQHVWEALLEVLTMEHAMEGRAPMAEPLREEEDWRRGSSSASRLVPQWAPALKRAMPMGPGFWYPG